MAPTSAMSATASPGFAGRRFYRGELAAEQARTICSFCSGVLNIVVPWCRIVGHWASLAIAVLLLAASLA